LDHAIVEIGTDSSISHKTVSRRELEESSSTGGTDYLSREEARQVKGNGLTGGAHTVCLWLSGLTMYPACPAHECRHGPLCGSTWRAIGTEAIVV
jgi:hypothetical protein